MALTRLQTNLRNFKNLCETLDKLNLKYEKDEEKFKVSFTAAVKEMPFDFIIRFDTDIDVVSLLSPIISDIAEERRGAMALAVTRANLHTAVSNFDLNTKEGRLIFRISHAYADTVLSTEAYRNMIMTSVSTIGYFYEKLLKVAQNDMTLKEICALVC